MNDDTAEPDGESTKKPKSHSKASWILHGSGAESNTPDRRDLRISEEMLNKLLRASRLEREKLRSFEEDLSSRKSESRSQDQEEASQPKPDESEKEHVDGTDESDEVEQSSRSALLANKLRQRKLRLKHDRQRLELRKRIADFAVNIVVAQLLVTNVVVAGYVFANISSVNPSVIIAWLTATVVEVIGILLVITKNLFPSTDGKRKQKKSEGSS